LFARIQSDRGTIRRVRVQLRGAGSAQSNPQLASRLYSELLRILARRGLLRVESQTPFEFAADSECAESPLPRSDSRDYAHARFGGAPCDTTRLRQCSIRFAPLCARAESPFLALSWHVNGIARTANSLPMTKVGFVMPDARRTRDSEVMMGILRGGGYELRRARTKPKCWCKHLQLHRGGARKNPWMPSWRWRAQEIWGGKELIVAGCLVERFRAQILEQVPEVDACGTGESSASWKRSRRIARVCPPSRLRFLSRFDARIVTTAEACGLHQNRRRLRSSLHVCIIPELRGKFRSRDSNR